jgi:predicted cupin superfamily sugar epimerase
MTFSSVLPQRAFAHKSAHYRLLPHREGGFFRETYRSPVLVPTPSGVRSLSTAIMYLLTLDDPSRFHRLRFDEVWFFHTGAPVEMVFLDPLETHIVGPTTPQVLAPGGRWMAARIAQTPPETAPGVAASAPAGTAFPRAAAMTPGPSLTAGSSLEGPDWALVGCMVSPGFEYDDFEAAGTDTLLSAHPEAAGLIRTLS